ncbi:MAG: ABC transporter ATP-binding protein [Geminicoccaceae bacterium]
MSPSTSPRASSSRCSARAAAARPRCSIIAGFLRQTAGTIRFDDKPIDDVPAHRRNTGMVFQNYAIFPHLGFRQYRLRPQGAARCAKAEVEARVGQMLELIQLAALRHRRPRELSSGQQQRVVLARAMVIQPDVLLMDEPLSNLDTAMRVHLRAEIRALQRQVGITTIYVTHDQEEALLDVRPRRRDEPRPGRADRHAARDLQRPETRFVAGFVGECNMLPGKVAEVLDGTATVALGEGGCSSWMAFPASPRARPARWPSAPGRRAAARARR